MVDQIDIARIKTGDRLRIDGDRIVVES